MKIVNTIKRMIALNNAIKRSANLQNKMFDNKTITNEKLDALDSLDDRLWDKFDTLKKEVKNWERSTKLTRSERIARRSQIDLVCRHLNIKWYDLR